MVTPANFIIAALDLTKIFVPEENTSTQLSDRLNTKHKSFLDIKTALQKKYSVFSRKH